MKTIRTVEELIARYGEPGEASRVKVTSFLTPAYRRMIEASPFVALATIVIGLTGTVLDLGVNIRVVQMPKEDKKDFDTAWTVRLIQDRIAVTAIAPGAFASNMNKEARDHAEEIKGHIPAGRIGTPEDMAAAAIYLASRAGDYVIGSTLTVDGGVTHLR